MNRLVFAEREYTELRARLLESTPLESAGWLLARSGRGCEGRRWVVIADEVADEADYLERTESAAVLEPAFIARGLKRARDEGASLFLVHTHPFSDWPTFSLRDAAGERTLAPTIYQRAPAGPHGSLVIGRVGFSARLFDAEGRAGEAIAQVVEVGPDVRVHASGSADEIDEMYDRNVRALGEAGQRLLSTLHVAIVGVGGTGSFAVEELARLGVGRLTLIDGETIERTNLNRVVGTTLGDIGYPKVAVLGEVARRARPDIELTPIEGSVLREAVARHLVDCDLIFCCTDSHGSRAVLNQLACQYLVPLIDVGVRIDAVNDRVIGAVSRVQMVAPSLACLACHPLLSPEAVRRDLQSDAARASDPYVVGSHEPQPAVVSINGTATSAAVTMFLSAITGVGNGTRHLVGRPFEGTVRAAVSPPRPDCVVCGKTNAARRADSWPLMWS